MHLCVFCGARNGSHARHLEAARDLGRRLAPRGITLVYGGSSTGLMGALADAVLEAGGKVVGIMPEGLVEEQAHAGLSELILTPDMATRKAAMAQRSDAFLALPGGFGTLDELFEMLTWSQLGLQDKPVGLLNSDGFWDGLLAFLERAKADGLIGEASLARLRCGADPEDILDGLLPGSALDR